MNFEFRIWDGQKFLEQCGNHLSLDGKNTVFKYENGGLKIVQEYPKEKIQQFTNAFDKNGRKIFEGDIVLFDNPDPYDNHEILTMIVGYNTRSMGYKLYNFPEDIGKKSGQNFFPEEVEVVGNVFDGAVKDGVNYGMYLKAK